jgi:hypothetical protein
MTRTFNQKDQENMESFIMADDDEEEGFEDEVANHAARHCATMTPARRKNSMSMTWRTNLGDAIRGSRDERRNGDRYESDEDEEDVEELVKKRGYILRSRRKSSMIRCSAKQRSKREDCLLHLPIDLKAP